MGWRLAWSATAQARLLELTDWLANRDTHAALRFVDKLERDVQVLAEHPELGAVWPQHPELGVRRLRTGSYFVYYELLEEEQEVLLLTIRHAREQPPTPADTGRE